MHAHIAVIQPGEKKRKKEKKQFCNQPETLRPTPDSTARSQNNKLLRCSCQITPTNNLLGIFFSIEIAPKIILKIFWGTFFLRPVPIYQLQEMIMMKFCCMIWQTDENSWDGTVLSFRSICPDEIINMLNCVEKKVGWRELQRRREGGMSFVIIRGRVR